MEAELTDKQQKLNIAQLIEASPRLKDLTKHAVDKSHQSIADIVDLCENDDERIAVVVTCIWTLLCVVLDLCIPEKLSTHAARMRVLGSALALIRVIIEKTSKGREDGVPSATNAGGIFGEHPGLD
jgi:hypothetical protein